MRRMTIPALLAAAALWYGCGGENGGPVDDTPCSLTITEPTAAADLRAGQLFDVRWEETGPADHVRIELLQGGDVVGTIEDVTPNDGFDPWYVDIFDGESGSGFTVRVTALGEDGCVVESDPFTILDTSGCDFAFAFGETTLVAGNEFEIRWNSVATTGRVDLLLERWDLSAIIAEDVEDDGSFPWIVDSFHHGTDEFRFVIRDHEVQDCTSSSELAEIIDDEICFIGIAPPFPDTVWHEGETMTIEFDTENTGPLLKVMLYAGDTFVGDILPEIAADAGSLQWDVNDFDFTQGNDRFNIRMADIQDPYCYGSSAQFTIDP